MIAYLIFYLFVSVVFFKTTTTFGTEKKIGIAIFFTAIFLFSGIRGSVGSDTPNYVLLFQNLTDSEYAKSQLTKIEPLFVIWAYLLRKVTDSNFLFILSYSGMQAGLLYFIFKKIENKYFVLIYIYIFYLNFHFNILRAGMAGLLFTYFLVERNKTMKTIAALAAPGFHVSILFFYPFFVFKYTLKNIFFYAIITLFLFFIAREYIEFFLDKGLDYKNYLTDYKLGIPKISIIISLYILFSLIIMRKSNAAYKISAALLILMYALEYLYPATYRLLTFSQMIYLYFLVDNLNKNFLQKKKFYVLWPLLAIYFYTHINGIINESNLLTIRINSGELTFDTLESTYIPYRIYFNDLKIQNIK